MEPITAVISDVPTRVPVFGTNPRGTNQKTVTVTVTPSPVPQGASVTVTLSTLNGTGSATFDDGSTTKNITQTVTLNVRGVANSSTKNNIQVAALVNGSVASSNTFTVSTWPYNFTVSLDRLNLHFGIAVTATWLSESGHLADLGNVVTREYLTCPNGVPNPPFTTTETFPNAFPPDGLAMTGGSQPDPHYYQPAWVDFSTSVTGSFDVVQEYQFKDTVLASAWRGVGHFHITRTVAKNPGATYTFTTSITGHAQGGGFNKSCTETP